MEAAAALQPSEASEIADRVVAAAGEIGQPALAAGEAVVAAAGAVAVAASAAAVSVAAVGSGGNSGDISWMPAEVQQKTWPSTIR